MERRYDFNQPRLTARVSIAITTAVVDARSTAPRGAILGGLNRDMIFRMQPIRQALERGIHKFQSKHRTGR